MTAAQMRLHGWDVFISPLVPEFNPVKRTVPVFKLHPSVPLPPDFRAEMDRWLAATFGTTKTHTIEVDERCVFVSETMRSLFVHRNTFSASLLDPTAARFERRE